MLLNLLTDKRAQETETLGLLGVEGDDLLLETTADEVVTGQPNVLGRRHGLERHLVLVRLLQLLTSDDLVDEAGLALDDNLGTLLHGLLLFSGDLAVGLAELLDIFTGLVAVEQVLERSLVKVVIDVVESVLGDVTDDQVGVLPDFTLGGLSLTDKELDKGRLAGTVRTEDGDTGGEGDLEGDVVELLDLGGGVLEVNVTHLGERLLLGLDTVEQRRSRELELVLLSRVELVVSLGLRDLLDEGLKVASVSLDLEAVQVEDVCADLVQEAGVVGDNDGCAGGQAGQVVDQPLNVEDIQVL